MTGQESTSRSVADFGNEKSTGFARVGELFVEANDLKTGNVDADVEMNRPILSLVEEDDGLVIDHIFKSLHTRILHCIGRSSIYKSGPCPFKVTNRTD
jgi:hypothetical protein